MRISIDDFGAGYTSLSQLTTLPVDELKIDRSLVMSMVSDPGNAMIVQSVIDLGHNLNLTLVAEGVETEESLTALASLDCDVAQGYHICRPLPPAAFDEWRAERTSTAPKPGRTPPNARTVTARTAGRTLEEGLRGHSLKAPDDESMDNDDGERVGCDTAVVARLLERAQCGEHDEALRLAEKALREPTGDLGDGAAGMHFVRFVALVVQGRSSEAMGAIDLMLQSAEREGNQGWRSCALSGRAYQRLMIGDRLADHDVHAVLQDLVDETALASGVEDSVIAENAHTGVALGYHQLRLYELALPQYEAAYAVSPQDGRQTGNRAMWQSSCTRKADPEQVLTALGPVHRLAAGARRHPSTGGRQMAEQGGTWQMSRRETVPDENGFFGGYGGQFLPPQLEAPFAEITKAYHEIENDAAFISELRYLRKHFQGRPTPVYHARTLSLENGGAQIYLKREDLNHTGAHKLNHCMGEVLLAKYMGKTKVIAETGAGQHGVALATAAAHFGLECEIHMGQVDIEKQAPNVSRMQLLGATVVPVSQGLRTLKEAVDSAFEAYLADYENSIYCIGSVVGPHPFPLMVRDFQRVVGIESREQFYEMTGNLPDVVEACVGGGSNAIGIFSAFLDDPVELIGVEPLGRGTAVGDHAATMTYGREGIIHGFKCYLLQDADGQPSPVYSCASGLDYPGVGPEHSYLKDAGRVEYVTSSDEACRDAFFMLSRKEGIIPALESAHAVAHALVKAREMKTGTILVNLSGRGDKDMDYVIENWGIGGTA